MPGVESVVRNGAFLAVVAAREEQAIKAADHLRRNVRWDTPELKPAESELPQALRDMASQDTVVHQTAGVAQASLRLLSADYSRPFTAHAAISPSAAIAIWEAELLTVWSHGQGMYPLRGAIARTMGLPEDKVRLIHREAAGCYGHDGADDAACDAAMIAMQLPSKPVRLQWSRQDEFRYEPLGSAMSMRVSAGLDRANNVTNWQYDVWSGTHSSRPAGKDGAGNLRAAREKQGPIPKPPTRNIPQPAGGGDRNALPLYTFPNQKISKHLVLEPPLTVSALRGLGAYANVFAIESFVDELATAAGEHPLDFRLRNLDDARAVAVLKSLRGPLMSKPAAPPTGWLSGRGLGFARFKNLSSYVGVVCEVHVDPESGELRVPLAVATVDAGLVISPDGLRNQIEGGIVQSTSWTLMEAVHYGDTRTQSNDWASYPILRFADVPRVSVKVIDRPEEPSLGAGEAAQGPTAAAIANAVTAACGIRLRDLPLTPDRVLAALQQKQKRSG
jgi:CO/xanthine dehydrogenase Mo-binding subunit